jgi:putative NADH-flavin reductase
VYEAGGNSGQYITEALLKTDKHTVTAITRNDSKSKLPQGVHVKHVDYDDHVSLVEALRGQDALVITLAAQGTPQQAKLIQAALMLMSLDLTQRMVSRCSK